MLGNPLIPGIIEPRPGSVKAGKVKSYDIQSHFWADVDTAEDFDNAEAYLSELSGKF